MVKATITVEMPEILDGRVYQHMVAEALRKHADYLWTSDAPKNGNDYFHMGDLGGMSIRWEVEHTGR